MESIFSAFSLYFLSFLLFNFSGSSVVCLGTSGDVGCEVGSAVSPLDWSDDWLWFPTDTADSFDLNEGDIAIVLTADTDGVNRPLLEIDEMVVLAAAFDGDVLIVDALLAEKDEGGDFPLRN